MRFPNLALLTSTLSFVLFLILGLITRYFYLIFQNLRGHQPVITHQMHIRPPYISEYVAGVLFLVGIITAIIGWILSKRQRQSGYGWLVRVSIFITVMWALMPIVYPTLFGVE